MKGSVSFNKALQQADIVHLCIPACEVPSIGIIKRDSLLILHDSVMSSSDLWINHHQSHSAIAVHMLMNDTNKVVINSESRLKDKAQHHFSSLMLSPVFLSINEHDRMCAFSQTPLLLLLPLMPMLESWSNEGLLTPSALDLLALLKKRSERWTDSTSVSLAKNRHIRDLIEMMREGIKEAPV